MSTMIAEVYDALKEAGASEEKAKAAAMALADYGNRFDRIDQDLGGVKADAAVHKTDLGGVKADVATLKSDVVILKTDVAVVKGDVAVLKTDVAVVRAELAMVKWIVSGIGFGVLLLVLRSFWPA
jgi:archaellum component FlaC